MEMVEGRKIEGQINAITNAYGWVISDFSKYTEIGENVRSPIFSFIKNNVVYEWQLSLYPNGKSVYSNGALYLYLRSHNKQEIRLKTKISLLNYDNEDVNEKSKSLKFTKGRSSCGYPFIVEKSVITNGKNCLLKDDKLTIKCEFWTENEVLERLKQIDCFEKMFDNHEFSDVEIVVINDDLVHNILAHKCILASKSSVFANMFAEEKNQGSCEIKVTDMSYESCVEMVRFMYIGKVCGLDEVVYELAPAANRYCIVGLKKFCEDYLCKNFTIDGALNLLHSANRWNMDRLKKNVLDFIVENRRKIMYEPSFERVGHILSPDLICELFRAIIYIVDK